MAAETAGFDVAPHQATWEGFTRLMKWGIAAVIIILGGMALFLL